VQLLEQQKKSPFNRNHAIRDAIGKAIYDQMGLDQSIHIFGEGAQVKVHYDAPDIERDFADRVHTLPISEDGNANFCVGASLLSIKPIYDLITADFLYRAMDSICNTAAKQNFLREDKSTIVIRSEFLTGGPTTGQRPEALFTHIPGLNVVVPSTPRDAYGLMLTALMTPGVTLFFEDRMIEDGEFNEKVGCVQEAIPFGQSRLCSMGKRGTTTILTYGLMRQVVQQALQPYEFNHDYYADEYPMLCDIIDLRCLYPIDWAFIKKMLERTGKLLIVEPDVIYGGVGAEIAATIAEEMPHVRVKRLGAPRATIPASKSLHDRMLPTREAIIDAIGRW